MLMIVGEGRLEYSQMSIKSIQSRSIHLTCLINYRLFTGILYTSVTK